MSEATPYTPPNAPVADTESGEYGEIRIFSARGRLGRARYFVYNVIMGFVIMLIQMVLQGGIMASAQMGGDPSAMLGTSLFIILPLAIAAFVLSVMWGVQRLHDLDKSGWLYLLMLVPLVNLIFYLYLLFAPGTPGPNRFGNPPPPNSTAVLVTAWVLGTLYVLMFIGGIVAAVLIPALNGGLQQM